MDGDSAGYETAPVSLPTILCDGDSVSGREKQSLLDLNEAASKRDQPPARRRSFGGHGRRRSLDVVTEEPVRPLPTEGGLTTARTDVTSTPIGPEEIAQLVRRPWTTSAERHVLWSALQEISLTSATISSRAVEGALLDLPDRYEPCPRRDEDGGDLSALLGTGEYAVVYSIRKQGEKKAVKKIESVFDALGTAKRTLRELRVLRMLRGHDNILNVDDVYFANSAASFRDVYLVSSAFATDLHTVLRESDENGLDENVLLFVVYQFLRGLKYVHSAQVIHRDLKPRNLLLTRDWDLVICDFGLARYVGMEDLFPLDRVQEDHRPEWQNDAVVDPAEDADDACTGGGGRRSGSMMLAPDPAEDADLTGYVGRGSLLDVLRSHTFVSEVFTAASCRAPSFAKNVMQDTDAGKVCHRLRIQS